MTHHQRSVANHRLHARGQIEQTHQIRGVAARLADQFRQHLFAGIRSGALPGLVASSLMNDLGFAQRMLASLRQVLLLGEGHAVARQMEVLMGEAPLIEGL